MSTAAHRRVVVTGAAGFIGSHLAEALLDAGHHVTAIDLRPVRLERPGDRLTIHRADLTEADLAPLLAGADAVFHLAGLGGVRASWGDQFPRYVAANLLATHRVLEACEHAGVRRLVYASSSSVYGSARRPSREDDPTAPASPYGVTKLAAERLCHAHAHRAEVRLSAVALRYFTVYGPRQRPGMAINRLLTAALTGAPVPLYGDGSQRREFTFVADIVRATIAAAHPAVPSTVINVGGGASVTLLDLIGLIEDVTDAPVILRHEPAQHGDVTATHADLSRARNLLGFRPEIGLRDGLAQHARWLQNQSHPLTDLVPDLLETTR